MERTKLAVGAKPSLFWYSSLLFCTACLVFLLGRQNGKVGGKLVFIGVCCVMFSLASREPPLSWHWAVSKTAVSNKIIAAGSSEPEPQPLSYLQSLLRLRGMLEEEVSELEA